MTVIYLKFDEQYQASKSTNSPDQYLDPEGKGVRQAGWTLCNFVYPEGLSDRQNWPGHLIVLSFDEPNVLTDGAKERGWSLFSELRRILQRLDNNKIPIFSLFLSTSGNFSVLSPDIKSDPSRRVVTEKLRPLHPITDISFDCLARPARNDSVSLNQVVQMDWIAHLGRPL